MAPRKKRKKKKELTITEFARMGGYALARKRSQEQRIAAARHAVTVRWAKAHEVTQATIVAPEPSLSPLNRPPEL